MSLITFKKKYGNSPIEKSLDTANSLVGNKHEKALQCFMNTSYFVVKEGLAFLEVPIAMYVAAKKTELTYKVINILIVPVLAWPH